MTKRCIAYLRVSSEGQRDNHSLPTQREGCLAFAAEQGWNVVDVVEEIYTATLLDRPRLAEVRNRVATGEAEVVLVYDQDRFSRVQRQTFRLLDELDEAGAEVWSARQGKFETGALGTFMTGARGFGAEIENEQRRERAMRGQRSRVEKGQLLGSASRATYGYQWAGELRPDGRLLKARLEVNEEEAVTVRRIYAEILAGVPMRAIAKRLNNDGIPSSSASLERYRTSGQWRHQSISALVRNPYYKGEAWGLVNIRRPVQKGHRYGGAKIDRTCGVRLPEGTVPALMSAAEWDRAQSVLADQPTYPSQIADAGQVLLRGGIIRCGNCGRAMRLAKRKNGNRYYQCNKMSNEVGACSKPSPTIKVEYVEDPVWRAVREILLDPPKLYDRFHSEAQAASERSALAGLQVKAKVVADKRARLFRNLELLDNEDAQALVPRLDALAAERRVLVVQIEALERRVASRADEHDRLARMLRWAQTEVQRVETMSVEAKRAILLELGVVVRVYPRTAMERFTVDIGARSQPVNFFGGIDWNSIKQPTPEERRETERLFSEAAGRGLDADLIRAVVTSPGSADGQYTWDYWDEHVQEALAQHARVLGLA